MKSAVVVFPGSNRERDMAHALKLVSGREPAMVWHGESELPAGTDLVVLPGGFSYGDYLRCGAIAAHAPIMTAVRNHARKGGLVMGVCNGFQILCEAELLPGILQRNASVKFICRDVHLKIERSDTPFTRGYNAGQVIRVPVAHGEGNYFASEGTIGRLEAEGRVLFRYTDRGRQARSEVERERRGQFDRRRAQREAQCARPDAASREPRRNCGRLHRRARAVRRAGRTFRASWHDADVIPNEPTITPELVAEHGLKPDEYERILQLIGREPTITELGIFSAMWNEHCSYKSSKIHLRTLPTSGPHVIQGPGENAGVISIGDGLAVVFKMESHNHPSYIEPYQGAATGVGGILRDVFTMGARPIACLNALSFGDPKHPKTRHLVSGVVAGVGGYGNSFGVPTVGGSVRFHERYNGNNLVNAMAVGLAETDKIFYAAASGVGMPIVYLGSKTGRDGIHGASMASAEFGEDSE